MQQLRVFIDNSLTQHVSGTTMPIFRNARLYCCIQFPALDVAGWSLGEPGRRQCALCV